MTYITAGDPDLDAVGGHPARARSRRRRRDRTGRAVLRPARRRPGDPACHRARVGHGRHPGPGARDRRPACAADVAAPLVLFTYANPMLRMGLRGLRPARARGGRRRRARRSTCRRKKPARFASRVRGRGGIDTIFLLSPTTTAVTRIRRAAALGSGFLYGISRLGVTGARERGGRLGARALAARVRARNRRCPWRSASAFRRPNTCAPSAACADAAVVGSALVQVIADHGTVAGARRAKSSGTCDGCGAEPRRPCGTRSTRSTR